MRLLAEGITRNCQGLGWRNRSNKKGEDKDEVDQHATVNTFPGLVHTARHTTRVVCTRSRRPNPRGAEASKVWRVRGVKS